MKKILSIVLILGLCFAAAAAAQEQEKEKKDSGIMEWLKGVQKKIEQIVPKKSLPVSTGVAGVRGAKEDDKTKLYWKGKKGDEAVTEEELAEFKSAVDLAMKGEKTAAAKELEKFMTQFPDSALVPDAKKTLDLMKEEGK